VQKKPFISTVCLVIDKQTAFIYNLETKAWFRQLLCHLDTKWIRPIHLRPTHGYVAAVQAAASPAVIVILTVVENLEK